MWLVTGLHHGHVKGHTRASLQISRGLELVRYAWTVCAAAHQCANHVQQRREQANTGHADERDQQRARQQRAETCANKIRRVKAGRPGGSALELPPVRQGNCIPTSTASANVSRAMMTLTITSARGAAHVIQQRQQQWEQRGVSGEKWPGATGCRCRTPRVGSRGAETRRPPMKTVTITPTW